MHIAITLLLCLAAAALPCQAAAQARVPVQDSAQAGAEQPSQQTWTPSTLYILAVSGFALTAGIVPLRDTVLATGDLEVRLWRFTLEEEAYVLRRTAGRWSATAVDRRRRPGDAPGGVRQQSGRLRALPDTAVARTWAALEARGLLTLREMPGRVHPDPTVQHGESYVFEVRRGTQYHAEGFAWVDRFPGGVAAPVRALFEAAAALDVSRVP